jgi:hypothetical protein
MVFTNVVRQDISDRNYSNATFRAKQGYKELHTPDAPFRRNRDFRPVPYGSYKGILNFRHSEPYVLLKNLKDLYYEDSNIVIKWAK